MDKTIEPQSFSLLVFNNHTQFLIILNLIMLPLAEAVLTRKVNIILIKCKCLDTLYNDFIESCQTVFFNPITRKNVSTQQQFLNGADLITR